MGDGHTEPPGSPISQHALINLKTMIPCLIIHLFYCTESDEEEPAPPAKRSRGTKKARAASPEAKDKGKSEHSKRVLAAGKAVAAADQAPGDGATSSMLASKSGAGRAGAQPVGKTNNRRKAKMGKQDPAGPTAPSHYEALCSPD